MATFLIVGWTFYHPTFYPVFLPPLFQVFPGAESVVVAQPEVFALVSVVSEPEVFVDIAVAFVVLVPVSVVAVEVDNSGRPKFFAFPNICSFPNFSSSG